MHGAWLRCHEALIGTFAPLLNPGERGVAAYGRPEPRERLSLAQEPSKAAVESLPRAAPGGVPEERPGLSSAIARPSHSGCAVVIPRHNLYKDDRLPEMERATQRPGGLMKRFLALIAAAALSALAIAGLAQAAKVTVVHGVPDLAVDVYVNGDLTLEDFQFETVTDPLDLPAGEYQIEVRAAGEPADSAPAISGSATVADDTNASIVAHLDESGSPTLSVFVNDTATIQAGDARLTVRHTAAAPAVDVLADGSALFTDLANPDGQVVVGRPCRHLLGRNRRDRHDGSGDRPRRPEPRRGHGLHRVRRRLARRCQPQRARADDLEPRRLAFRRPVRHGRARRHLERVPGVGDRAAVDRRRRRRDLRPGLRPLEALGKTIRRGRPAPAGHPDETHSTPLASGHERLGARGRPGLVDRVAAGHLDRLARGARPRRSVAHVRPGGCAEGRASRSSVPPRSRPAAASRRPRAQRARRGPA